MSNSTETSQLDWRKVLLDHLEEYAGMAYQMYTDMGRGALLINLRQSGEDPTRREPAITLAYKPDEPGNLSQWGDEELSRLVRSYDPKAEFIYLCILAEGLAYGRLRPASPFESHKRMRAAAREKGIEG